MNDDFDVIDDEDDVGPRTRPAGTRLNLTEEIEDFRDRTLPRIFPKYGSRYRELIQKDWAATQKLFDDKTTATKKLYGSKFRKAVFDAIKVREQDAKRREELLATMKDLLKTDPEVLNEVKEHYRENISKNANKLVRVEHYAKMVEIATRWLTGDSDELRALGLMLVTGRRFYEVLVAGEFGRTVIQLERGKMSPIWRMDFSGQMKTREAEGTKFDTLYNIPTLAPVAKVIKAVNLLRSSPMGKEIAAMGQEFANTHYNPRLNKILRASAIGELWPKGDVLTIKQLRTLYAEVCFKHHAPSDKHKDAYFAEILGHREGDMNTALSYVRYYLDEKDRDFAQAEMDQMIKKRDEDEAAYWAQRKADDEAAALVAAEKEERRRARKAKHEGEDGEHRNE